MIPDITFKEFVNNLFGYTKVPLESRGWITAKKDKLFTYSYTWGEIEDYISRWLEKVPASRLDDEVNTAFDILDKIVDNWYLINFDNPTGRCDYDENLKLYSQLDNEEFELLDYLKDYILKRAKEAKQLKEGSEEVKQTKKKKQKPKEEVFEDYLLCAPEEKIILMEKLKQLYKTAKAKNGFIIYRALEEAGYIVIREWGREEVYQAINKRFGKNFSNQSYQGHYHSKEINHCLNEITGIKDRLKS